MGTPGPTPYYPTPTPSGGNHKVETDPGDGRTVTVGQVITYQIYWENKRGGTASVTIRDPLDAGVDFFSASDGGVYDPATHTVWWHLNDQPAGARGYVTLRVTVNNNALMFGIVKNQAYVDDEPTEVPKNPLPNSPKTGDVNRPGLWLVMMAAAMTGAGLAGTAARRRRKRSKH